MTVLPSSNNKPAKHKNMEPVKDWERSNAQEWDDVSIASMSPSVTPRNLGEPSTSQQQITPKSAATTIGNTTSQVTPPIQHRHTEGGGSGSSFSQARSAHASGSGSGQNSSLANHGQYRQHWTAYPLSNEISLLPYQRHESNQYNPAERRPGPTTDEKKRISKWAKPQGLVTTRGGIRNNDLSIKEAERNSYRSRPNKDEEFPVTGYYLWPKGYGDPMALLDSKLERLDTLRVSFKVHIDWDDENQCLRLNSRGPDAEDNINSAIKGIRQAYLGAKAQSISASPVYIIVPPTAFAMRSIVQPRTLEHRTGYHHEVVTSIELAGEPFSAKERDDWESKRPSILEGNFNLFQTSLVKFTLPLADLRGWMRMRVHLGHINLGEYQTGFAESKYSLGMFISMMKKSRVTTAGTFDRKMDAANAMKAIQNIVERPTQFCPRKSNTPTLGEVLNEPRHTEIIFVVTPGSGSQGFRIETDIDCANTKDRGGFQTGTTKLFHNDRRNKRFEVTMVNLESKLDWTLEVITDGSIPQVPEPLLSLMESSLSSRSAERTDSLGLPYPCVSPRAPTDFLVKSVVLRSVFQYIWVESGHVVEIAIYREWQGYDTRPEPAMQASVSLFHPDWDCEMESIENTTLERNWDKHLCKFFDQSCITGEAGVKAGLRKLIEEIEEIQNFLIGGATKSTPTEETPIPGTTDHQL